MVALLVFIIATLEIVFGRKKLLDAKGPFGDSVFKAPARYAFERPNKWAAIMKEARSIRRRDLHFDRELRGAFKPWASVKQIRSFPILF